MGFPYGADEDAAFIIAWLELNNFKGVKILHKLITSKNQKYDGIIRNIHLSEKIDFKSSTILMKGSNLIDYLLSKFDHKKKISIIIKNCNDPILFLPLLYKISNENNDLELIFCDEKNKIFRYKIQNKEITFESKLDRKLVLNKEVKIIVNDQKTLKNFSKNKIIDQKIILKNLSQSIYPNEKLWKKISQVANKTFVPESDESRNKGAGGGDAND